MEEPKEDAYSSVVTSNSVQLFITLAALNNLDVLSADIQNAYLTAKVTGKYWYRAGLEFGFDCGRPAIIVRALYGLKSTGATFRAHLASTLRSMGFQSCKADPDVWMRKATKPDKSKYYEYILAYVDDIIGCSHNIKAVFEDIGSRFKFKEGSVQEPELYLGADIQKWYIDDAPNPNKPQWALSSTKYTRKAIAEVDLELKKVGRQLVKKASTPLASGYRPELDTSPELDSTRQTYYQGLIGVLRWICELG